MTKQQFQAHCLQHNCTAHYQGQTKTMFVFGSINNLKKATRPNIKSGEVYGHYNNPMGGRLLFNVKVQATS